MSTPPSSTARTVFVRFVPPSANVRRHHLEDLFSEIGPIKKSSVIVPTTTTSEQDQVASSYGFVKYVSEDDAQKAAEKLDRSMLQISAQEKIQVRVERASDVAHNNKDKQKEKTDKGKKADDELSHKKTNRLILRNLSFYAKESHIRQALQSFGQIEDIHLPTVSDKSDSKTKTFNRGFCFVTFEKAKDAQKCLMAKEIEIYKRKVSIAKALHKAGYEKLKGDNKDSAKKNKSDKDVPSLEKEDSGSDNDDDSSGSDDSESASSDDGGDGDDKNKTNESGHAEKDDSDSSQSSGESESEGDNDSENKSVSGEDDADEKDNENTKDADAVAEKRSLFLRNLPFDATRHDIFEAFRKYGRISAIYIVKDKTSGLPRGTAFVSYQTQGAAQRALQASGSDSFASQRDVSEGNADTPSKPDDGALDDTGIVLRGRRIYVNVAVDRDTASTLTLDKQADRGKAVGKDRRNLYLKGEGRVDNDGENDNFDQLPEQDKLKRQKAWSDKNTKLKSPLFLISPTRLSIRNIAKDVDERSLKKLCVTALKRGLQKKLVTVEDQVAQWRAAGEMTTREIIQKVDSLESKDVIIPEFDEKNVRKFIPSVVVERDFSSNSKEGAPSRGFGFVEFLHHTHALAVLRELNNNIAYSEEYVSGGKHAIAQKGKRNKKKRKSDDEVEVKVPRLIVEFSVENRAKAKKQIEHKAAQRANTIKQKIEHKEKTGGVEKKLEKKKSRGARQRERKRKQKEQGTTDEPNSAEASPTKKPKIAKDQNDVEAKVPKKQTSKAVKPAKKRKVDEAEENLSKLVDSYEKSLVPAKGEPETNKKQRKQTEKRWFED